VHRVVEPRRFARDEARRLPRFGILRLDPLRHRQRQAADRGDRLAELVVQLACDRAALLLDMVIDPAGQLAVVGQALLGQRGAALGLDVLAQHADHAVERRAALAEQRLSDNRELTRWIDHHVEQERRTIARELHDELGQSVTAIRSMALSVAQRVHAHDAESEQAARLIADESSRLYDAMHGLIPRLTPLVLDSFGLNEALVDLAERTRRSHPAVQLALQVDLGDAQLAGDVALALYRAAQEGITNALRHGQAEVLQLGLRAAPDGLTLDVVDDGQGLPAEGTLRSGHYGLRWLAERVEALGGHFSIQAASPRGVHLQVRLPLAA
jgi:two-component system, NarL family, sensor histidine kinase UhpB